MRDTSRQAPDAGAVEKILTWLHKALQSAENRLPPDCQHIHAWLQADGFHELERMLRAGQIAVNWMADKPCTALMLLPPKQQMLLVHESEAQPETQLQSAHSNNLRSMLTSMERRACDFAMQQVDLMDISTIPLLTDRSILPGYVRQTGHIYRRSLKARLGSVRRSILQQCDALGIPADYGWRRQLPIQRQARRLVALGEDCFQRQQLATAATANAWQSLQGQAELAGVDLQLVSAYRSHDYQYQLVRRKLQQGQRIEQILQVSAAPGFSEHHTGRALDLTTSGCAVLTEAFADTDAYRWLLRHAGGFGFKLSYPRDNVHGIAWEPWHWCWQPLQSGHDPHA
jgi:D-alanyl-D-alanine carboxypeptidase